MSFIKSISQMHVTRHMIEYMDCDRLPGHLTSNDSRVAGVVLGNVLLDLANQVSANISGLGVNATAHTAKECNGGSTQTVPGNGLVDALPVVTIYLS